jgi:oligoribonuclease NrnB/cAMP/cGMP phosphodiesterase (DHH superfamily)
MEVLYVISTHAKCFDGAAAAALLEMYCVSRGLKYVTIPHVLGKSYLREIGRYLQTRRSIVILMFDVSPDDELIEVILTYPHIRIVCGDHHIGTKSKLDRLASAGDHRVSVRFDNTISGAQLAWEWIHMTIEGRMDTLGVVLDDDDGTTSRLLKAICAADMFQHKGDKNLEAIDSVLHMMYTPDVPTLKYLLTKTDAYDELVRDGAICSRIKDNISRDLLQRGQMYRMNKRAIMMIRMAGGFVPEDCTVFYVQGIPHPSSEMGYLHTTADFIWIWSKIESSPSKKFTVSVRRGKESDLRCDLVASALGEGNGHAAAAGMAFDYEPLKFLMA